MLTSDSNDSRTAVGASCTAATRAVSCSSLRSSTTRASKISVACSPVMVARTSGLVASSVACSGVTTSGTVLPFCIVVLVTWVVGGLEVELEASGTLTVTSETVVEEVVGIIVVVVCTIELEVDDAVLDDGLTVVVVLGRVDVARLKVDVVVGGSGSVVVVLDDIDELDVVDGSLVEDVVVAIVVVVHTAIVLNAESGTIAHSF